MQAGSSYWQRGDAWNVGGTSMRVTTRRSPASWRGPAPARCRCTFPGRGCRRRCESRSAVPPPSRTPRRSWNSTANACHACWSISCCGTTVRPGICCGCRSTRIAFRAFAARRGHSAARWSPRERATRFRPMPLDRARARPRSPLERSSDRDCRWSARIPRSASCSRRK